MQLTQAKFAFETGWQDLPNASDWDSEQTLILAFCSPKFLDDPSAIIELGKKYPESTVVGCSTAGEIQGPNLSDSSIVVNFCRFQQAQFKVAGHAMLAPAASESVGIALSEELMSHRGLRGAIVLSDGLSANGSKLIGGFNRGLGSSKIPVGGGLAGDGSDFLRTFVVYDGVVKTHFALAIGFYGDGLDVQVASRGGWDIFGPERIVTKSTGNVLFEIDGRPVLDLYKEYLGERASGLPASGLLFPLEIYPAGQPEKRLVRTILAMDEAQKSFTFAGDIPEGWTAQLMRANFDRIIDGAGQAFASASEALKASDEPSLVLAISCVGRRLVLGARSPEELEAITSELSQSSKVIGFYSYGELAPVAQGSPCELHNQSMTLFILNEANSSLSRQAG